MPADRAPLLAVCGSLKPAPGREGPSACRELLKLALAPVMSQFPLIEMLDLREAGLPAFDGRESGEYEHAALSAARAAVEGAAGYVISIPAYWGGVGAGFKNFIETVCGPGYDCRPSPFANKPAAVLIVGSEPRTARATAPQVEAVLEALGLIPVTAPIVVGDPSEIEDVERAVRELTAAAASVALALPAALALRNAAKR
jgi:NAD(P)H-dependent FMN reductase